MDISRVIVIGAGVMGSGIAQTLAVAGCDVTCCDVDEEQIELSRRLVQAGRYGLRRAVELGRLTDEEAAEARDRVRFSLDAEAAVADCDLVLEAVPEDLALKAGLFATYDKLAPAHALLASNTSGLPIGVLADATERPGQVIGWHWASPAPVMPLAEIVVTPVTAEATIDAIVDLATSCGKNPVVVADNPAKWGHVGNRVYAAAVAEAIAIVSEGLTDAQGVDQILMDAFGWPAGPFGVGRGARAGWVDEPAGSAR